MSRLFGQPESGDQPKMFTREIDRRIITGFWKDKEEVLRLLVEEGFSRQAVLERAERIGLDKWPSPSSGGLDLVVVRECLRCEQVFLALGHFNRLCRRCRDR